jgi:hypothetical protein
MEVMTNEFLLSTPDAIFLADFEGCRISSRNFGHRDHVRAAWAYVMRYGIVEGARMMDTAIARFAAYHGHRQKYHRTMTAAWIHLVAAHALPHPVQTFDEFIVHHSRLLDKSLIECFYSRAALFSDHARTGWVEPDVRPFPMVA